MWHNTTVVEIKAEYPLSPRHNCVTGGSYEKLQQIQYILPGILSNLLSGGKKGVCLLFGVSVDSLAIHFFMFMEVQSH